MALVAERFRHQRVSTIELLLMLMEIRQPNIL
ncbi:MAG TPA: hypothetical protein [Caudoviricetes sp.]|nr:MAG TPA: hypothetical protein [Caudoviricetes sp.]